MTANTPSTVLSSVSSAIVVTSGVQATRWYARPDGRSGAVLRRPLCGAAGPPDDLVAPPYDAVSEEERERLAGRSPYNVVHLTLPESPAERAGLSRVALGRILEREDAPAAWLLVEDYLGPDGVARERRGVVTSVGVEPYESGSVLPHERTYRRIKDERLELLQETRVQPEPILLLLDGPLAASPPDREPDVEADGSRLWRLPELDLDPLEGSGLLIADGHHRYEARSSWEIGLASWRSSSRRRIPACTCSRRTAYSPAARISRSGAKVRRSGAWRRRSPASRRSPRHGPRLSRIAAGGGAPPRTRGRARRRARRRLRARGDRVHAARGRGRRRRRSGCCRRGVPPARATGGGRLRGRAAR